jgi:hypothetical protein
MGKKKSRSRSEMNIPDHISESLETIFCVKILKFFLCGSGSGIRNLFDPGIRMRKKFGSGILDPG